MHGLSFNMKGLRVEAFRVGMGFGFLAEEFVDAQAEERDDEEDADDVAEANRTAFAGDLG